MKLAILALEGCMHSAIAGSSFRKAFRKLTLMSPQAYRARRMERAA